jgi:hypothetical protein
MGDAAYYRLEEDYGKAMGVSPINGRFIVCSDAWESYGSQFHRWEL